MIKKQHIVLFLPLFLLLSCSEETKLPGEFEVLAQLEKGSNEFPWARGEELSLYGRLKNGEQQLLGSGFISETIHKIEIKNSLIDRLLKGDLSKLHAFYPASFVFEKGSTTLNIQEQSDQQRLHIFSSSFDLTRSDLERGNRVARF